MSNVTVTRQGPEAMADNPSRVDVADYTTAAREFRPTQQRDDWRIIAVKAIVAVGAFLVLGLAYYIWRSLYCWAGGFEVAATCRGLAHAEPVALFSVGMVAFGVILWRSIAFAQADLRQRRAYANRTNLTLDRWGDQVPADLFDRLSVPALLSYLEQRTHANILLKERTAQHEIYWGVNSLSMPPNKEAPALPAPGMPSVPPAQWLGWINSLPHALLAAETGGGKSTTAKHILAPRLAAGEDVFIIDPHSSQWYDLPSVGGGENWPVVERAIGAVEREYRARLEHREAYRRETGRELPVTNFTRLTVVLDEANNARLALDRAPRGKLSTWQRFTQVMGSGARKVNISLLLMAQSANADDIGLSAAMRENFTRVALDSAAARKLIVAEETNPERRKALAASLEGQQYPAVCEFRGQVHTLDRAGLDRAPDVTDARACAWQGWDYLTDAPVRPSDEGGDSAIAEIGRTDGPADRGQQDETYYKESMVISLKRAGLNRTEIRQQLQGLGLGLTNEEYGETLARHGLS